MTETIITKPDGSVWEVWTDTATGQPVERRIIDKRKLPRPQAVRDRIAATQKARWERIRLLEAKYGGKHNKTSYHKDKRP